MPDSLETDGDRTSRAASEPAERFVWPAAEHRTVDWKTDPDQFINGKRPNYADRMLVEITVEVPPKIAHLDARLPAELAERCRHGEAEITRLDALYGAHPVGISSFLVRSESVASSRIEQVYADPEDVARASINEEASRAALTTAAAARAMSTLVSRQRADDPFSETALLEAHRELLEDEPGNKSFAGRYRPMQNWIGGSDFCPRNAIHVPPPAAEVEPLMRDLAAFMNRTDIPPLAQAALAHGQFEAIHPFVDGNGRIGRAVIAASLRRREVTKQVTIPIAAMMLADVDSYFEVLIGYRNGDAHGLVSYLVEVAEVATAEAGTAAHRLSELPKNWRDAVRPRRGSAAAHLIDSLVSNPVINAAVARELTGTTMPSTYQAIDKLTSAGVLREITGTARNRVWLAADVTTELAELDERIGRRAQPSKRWR
ncbi:Fic family protein [Saccharopolyspora sp. TS4A08]|uniref:Fic family protein n=1 Tax=Saccharopolyspora ipomoeae TaxID=3042027 RepID=A0ABT6PVN8_9PSEU|nr:Fic family protein [Saccharopolyspora sp. TS4A08]MDI2031703.1 Fic family protein [Saccharopolyspora sp. TS4A08]